MMEKLNYIELETTLSEESVQKVLNNFKSFYRPVAAGKKEERPLLGPPFDKEMAAKIDHTILKAEALPPEIEKLCAEARQYSFASVCVNSCYVTMCSELLKGTKVKVCTVVGFPLGAVTTETKAFEAAQAVTNGATEVDMVINVGMLKAGDYNYVYNDIKQVVVSSQKASPEKIITKVIIETALLTDEEKIKVCLIAKLAGAHFVKTSTGFSKAGAAAYDVALMKFVVGKSMKVKASGGIRTREDADIMVKNGADRIGASAGIAIVTY